MVQRILFILFLSFSTAYAQDTGWTISNAGVGTSFGSDVETDTDGNVYAFGSFTGTVDLDPSSNVAQLNAIVGETACYIAKYDAVGNYLWSKKLSGVVFAQDLLALDSHGNVLIALSFQDSLIDLNGNIYYSLAGSMDIGILKLDGDGNQLWIKFTQTNTLERFFCMKVDNQDHILLNGVFTSTLDIDFGPGTELISPAGSFDEFVLKLDELGDFMWVQTWYGGLDEVQMDGQRMDIVDMAIDTSRNVWLTGYFNTTIDFDPSSGDFTVQNTTNDFRAFALKLDQSGNFLWAKTFASTMEISSAEIGVNEQNEAVIGGVYQGTVQLGSETFYSPDNQNAYLLKMDENGTTQWARNIQCQGITNISALEVLSTGVIQFVGVFHDTIYFMSQNIGRQLIPVNPIDTYCAWYTNSGDVKWVTQFEGAAVIILDITKGSDDTVAMTGYYKGIIDFNLGSLVEYETSQHSHHGFVKKMYFDPSISLGLEEEEIHLSYTNPVNDYLFYQSDATIEKASIFSIDGSMVSEINNPEGEIDFRGIDSGVYLVHFKSGKGMLTARIVHL